MRMHVGETMKILDFVLGRRLANREHEERKIGWVSGIPAIGLDGLGSSSYGPEAALTVLIPLGALSLAYVGWVIAPIILLLIALYFSYRQTVLAYPSNGGAYTVAKENLGPGASLVAAAALMIDYVLNVAVGISAGVGALTSSLPSLHPWTLELCLGILALVALANLRGTREAGLLFAVPTYLFLASFLGIIGWGLFRLATGNAEPVVAPPPLKGAVEAASLWLLLRAFAAGCTAMTGDADDAAAVRVGPAAHGGGEPVGEAVAVEGKVRRLVAWPYRGRGELQAGIEHQRRIAAGAVGDQTTAVLVPDR